ncbi:PTS system mannose/fructose/sorbose family transporter subunit IID [Irregularibacter muris]|uniref:PTS system mannose/fructose/sorbose family transporter subunit IID n=1 Tax=Irregularibacter muris TaxID=1796619 RepID=A0AAE3HCC6_9FIRM|nr:PTS system mannose/fructose/sorbose family transporter subunit IID [Irregularibacter muris]MCR1897642.1 PTS system mannose/fructose/sorbose family transporter subunit IID [Irregularibacter muris]
MSEQISKTKPIVLSQKDKTRSFMTWYMGCEVSNSYERMQSVAFCASMIPILRKLYRKKDDLSKALTRHLNFFNSQGTWANLIHGVTVAMEEEKANSDSIPDEAITGIKTGLMGPISGIGDTIDWGTLKTIFAALAVTFGITGSSLGAFIPFLFVIATLFEGYYLWKLGYTLGRESIKSILQSGWIQELITGASILGLFMMGSLSANFIKISTPVSINLSNTNGISIQEILDGIAPGLLPLAVVFGIYYYLKNKSQNISVLLVIILAISLIGSYFGIL